MIRRISTLVGGVCLLLLGAADAAARPSGCRARPNVLLVVLEGVRFDATQVDPAARNATPALRRLAAQSVSFTRAYSTSDMAPVTYFSLLTGFESGYGSPFDRQQASLAYQLSRVGYRSFSLKSSPVGGSMAGFAVQDTAAAEWEALDPFTKRARTLEFRQRLSLYGASVNDFNEATLRSSPERTLQRLLRNLDGRQPFVGLVGLSAADPWTPDPAHYDRGSESVSVSDLRERTIPEELQHPDTIADEKRRSLVKDVLDRAWNRPWSTTLDLTPEQVSVYRSRYEAEVRDVDRAVGQLLDELEKRALLDSTIVVVTSSVGMALGEDDLISVSFRDRGDREALRHVPLLMRLPACYGVKPAEIDREVTTADIPLTIYDLVGIDAGPVFAKVPLPVGKSMASALSGLRPVAMKRTTGSAPGGPGFGLLDDRRIRLAGAADVDARRSALVEYVWGKDGFPRGLLPSRIDLNVESPVPLRAAGVRVDRLRVGRGRDAFHFIPAKGNGELVVVHQGHTCGGLGDPAAGLGELINSLVDAGYGVFGLEMPRQRRGDCAAGGHDGLFAGSGDIGPRFRPFLEPVAAALNYLQSSAGRDSFPPYRRFHMVGFSGGGWTTTLYAALDERIATSVSIAGSVPLYLRSGFSIGDAEQREPGLYRIAGYPELYVLGSFGAGRSSLQVLNRNDTCCFGAAQQGETFERDVRTYEEQVRSVLGQLGAGRTAFGVAIDDEATHHTVSLHAVREIILPALRAAAR